MLRSLSVFVLLVWLLVTAVGANADEAENQTASPLPQAHSHNDYYRPRPLQDALDQGFASVEADVFLVDGELLVGHDKRELKPDRTLEALYVKPLAERVAQNSGRVHRGGSTFMLLVDIKENGAAAYAALDSLLKRF